MRSFSIIPVPPRVGLSPGDIGPRTFANFSTFPTGTKLVADGTLTTTRFVNLSAFGAATRLIAGIEDGEFILSTAFANESTFGTARLAEAPPDSSFRLPHFANVSTFGSETALSVAGADGSFRLSAPFINTSTFGGSTVLAGTSPDEGAIGEGAIATSDVS